MCNCFSCSSIGSTGDCNRCVYNGTNHICIGCDLSNNNNNKYVLWDGSGCSSKKKILILIICKFIYKL